MIKSRKAMVAAGAAAALVAVAAYLKMTGDPATSEEAGEEEGTAAETDGEGG